MGERIANVHPKTYKDVQYRSTLEAITAEILDKLGISFQYEPYTFEIFKGRHFPYEKDKVRSIHYKPDFIIDNIIIECKGFETPEWRIKKKLIYQYLYTNAPDFYFHEVHNTKQLAEALDQHWTSLGFAIEAIPKPPKPKKRNKEIINPESLLPKKFNTLAEAMRVLKYQDSTLVGRPISTILSSLTGDKEYVFGYKWSLTKLNL